MNLEPIKKISKEELECIILGGAFLGSGGGGSIAQAETIKEYILKKTDKVIVKKYDEICDEEDGAVVAIMGSPSKSNGKKDDDLSAPKRSFEKLAEFKNTEFSFSVPVEVGAVNTIVPFAVAAELNIPVIDGDGAGRAVPQLEITTFAQAGISPSPAVLVNSISSEHPQLEINLEFDKTSTEQSLSDTLESTARGIITTDEFGAVGAISTYSLSGKDLSKAIIKDTISFAYHIGKKVKDAIKEGKNPVNNLLNWFDSMELRHYEFGEGKVIKKSVTSLGGFDIGEIEIKDEKTGDVLQIKYKNEILIAYLNGKVWGMVPDLMCYMTPQGPVSNVEIKEGDRVTLIGLPGPLEMKNEFTIEKFMNVLKHLDIYHGDYQPIEEIHN